MKRFNSCVLGFGLTALALAGCASVSPAGVEGPGVSSLGRGPDVGDAVPLPVEPPSEVEIAAIPNQHFAEALGPVLEALPNDYAFFYFDSDQKPVIGFANKAVPAAMEAVTSTGQQAQIIEDTGFTRAEYAAAADRFIVALEATWPQDVPFPMFGERPDLGVGTIGAILVTPDAARSSEEPTEVLEVATRLIEEADTESPFSIQIDETRVYGEGHAASSEGLAL